jgi:hypothetical protein
MTIDNHGGQDNQMNAYPGLQARAHSLVALEQSALYAARLAIARWINTSAQATASVDVPAAGLARAGWYEQAQQNFQEWLGRGGFAQYDVACADMPAPGTPGGAEAAGALSIRTEFHPAPNCIG